MKKTLITLLLIIFIFVLNGCKSVLTTEAVSTPFGTTESELYTTESELLTTDYLTTETIMTTREQVTFDLTTEAFKESFIDIEMGYYHSIALTNNGRVFTFGLNNEGALGNVGMPISYSPVDITHQFTLNADEVIVDVDCGHFHSVALTSQNRLFMWGDNYYLQIPGTTSKTVNQPFDVTDYLTLEDDETIVKFDVGAAFTGVLTSKKRLILWGHNGNNELGFVSESVNVGPSDITRFIALQEGETIENFEIGYRHSGVLTSLGRVFAWGDNIAGQVGNNSHATTQKTPIEINWFFDDSQTYQVNQIEFGYWFSSAIMTTGEVFMWGSNLHGEIGVGDLSFDKQWIPINITEYFNLDDGDAVENVYPGGFHLFATTQNGEVYGWGREADGRLGKSFRYDVISPTLMTDVFALEEGESIVSFSSGYGSSSLLTSKGRIFVWGLNDYGQLGLGTDMNYAYPVELLMPE